LSERPRTLVFTGTGKGKTTAALGMALRAAGHGMPVLVVQFVKGQRPSGELRAVRHLPDVRIERYGLGFVRELPETEGHREAARRGLERVAQAVTSGDYGLVVLDEVCYAVDAGLVGAREVVECVRAARCHVVVTGRHCPDELIELADTVTRMQAVKHGLQSGLPAQKGVEL
jgi:cob(I)alamin adenosyltransferase